MQEIAKHKDAITRALNLFVAPDVLFDLADTVRYHFDQAVIEARQAGRDEYKKKVIEFVGEIASRGH